MTRANGIIEVALHTGGDSYLHSGRGHEEMPHAFWEIGADPDNRVMILTGTGRDFCPRGDWGTFAPMADPKAGARTIWEGTRLLTALLDIDIPIIGAANGAAHVHSELLVLSDILIADDHATFRDNHLDLGVVPGDGNHTAWLNALGENRGRYFLLTSQTLTARQAHDYGVVAEVLPVGELLPRARELAEILVKQPPLTLRYSRMALTQRLKRLIVETVPYGLAVEALSAAGRTAAAPAASGGRPLAPEAAIAKWIEKNTGARVKSVRREGRWRPAWYAEVDLHGRSAALYVRGDRGHGFSYPIEREAATLRLFERHGIPVPHVHGVMDEPKAIVMDKVPGDRQVSGISDAKEQLAAIDAYLDHLVRIHRIPVDEAAAAGIEVPTEAAGLHLAFHSVRGATYRRLKSRPEPMVEFAMKWLARNVPTHRRRPAVAVVDAGQFLVDGGRVTAIYDLELVHVTDPQADLAGLRIRNAFEPLADLRHIYRRYTELSADPVDPATVNFHTVAFALSANQAIARIRAQRARDWVQYYTWEVSGSLLALSALAEEIGVELRAPRVLDEPPTELLSDSLISALDSWSRPDDPYERALALDLIEHMRLVIARGPDLDAEHVDDVAALVGRRAASAVEADADLERFVLDAGPDQDAAIVALLARRAHRQRLLIPAMDPDSSAAGAVGPHIDNCYLTPLAALLQ